MVTTLSPTATSAVLEPASEFHAQPNQPPAFASGSAAQPSFEPAPQPSTAMGHDARGRLAESAREGDVAAARLVLAYTIGKPAPAVDPDALDLQEWQHW